MSPPIPLDLSPVTASLAALALGSVSFWAYFHRVETHLHGLSYIATFLASCAAIAVAMVKVQSYGVSDAAVFTASVGASFLVGAFGNCLVFRIFLNPLNKIPGPWMARVSSLWLTSQLGKSDGFLVLERLHQKYGKFVRVGSNDVSIIDPDVMEKAYGVKSRITKAAWYDNDQPLVSMHTTRDKGLHDRRRRVWAPAFSEKALRDYETEIHKFVVTLTEQIGKHGDEPVNITKWFNLFSFDVMGLLAFGKVYGLLEKGEKPMELEMLNEGMQPLAFRFPPWFFKILTSIPGAAAGYMKFVNFCVGELTWRVKNAQETKRDADILGWLLKAYQDVPHPEKDPMLQADVRLIIVAGSDTTAATLTYLFYHLAAEPEQAEKLREELYPLAQGEWQEKDLRNCERLNGCINETLRLHPPVPSGVFRLTPPEGMKVSDTWIPGNVQFFTPQYVMGRDEDVYAEAERFIPERWYSEGDKIKHKDAFAPFSMGPYGCIGKNLAMMELRTLTTSLLMTYDMKLAPNEDGHRVLKLTKDHFTVELGDCDVVFTKRKA